MKRDAAIVAERVSYPPHLAERVVSAWPSDLPLELTRRELEDALSACFLASLTTEEGRPVRFRLLLTPPSSLPEDGAPNRAALRLRFAASRPLEPDELRRLSPAVPFESSLIGAHVEDGRLRIWGIAHSGAAWLAPSWGGRRAGSNWTLAPIIHVTGPGRLAVRAAGRLIAGLERGVLVSSAIDVFESAWLPELFTDLHDHMRRAHHSAMPPAGEWSAVDDSLVRTVSQHMVRRVVRLIRGAGHGGMILYDDFDHGLDGDDRAILVKYAFASDEPRRRYQTLLQALMRSMAAASAKRSIGWEDFRDADDPLLAEIEHEIFELSRVVASLAAIDGAVVLNKRVELLGFGAEVSAELPAPRQVWRALDIEGTRRECDATESVGTRHRAAYRFVQSHPHGLAVVVSHDGAVRFVAWRDDGVSYWEQSVSP
jgi:hypothetical protein